MKKENKKKESKPKPDRELTPEDYKEVDRKLDESFPDSLFDGWEYK
jgi:hypothetical protein